MLIDRIEILESDIHEIKTNLWALPTWIPLTSSYAKECGYKTVDGLRNWCMRNLSPEEFIQKGHFWSIKRTALAKIKFKSGTI